MAQCGLRIKFQVSCLKGKQLTLLGERAWGEKWWLHCNFSPLGIIVFLTLSRTKRHEMGVTNTTGTSPFMGPSPSSFIPLCVWKKKFLIKINHIQMWLLPTFPALSLLSELNISSCFFLCLHRPFLWPKSLPLTKLLMQFLEILIDALHLMTWSSLFLHVQFLSQSRGRTYRDNRAI